MDLPLRLQYAADSFHEKVVTSPSPRSSHLRNSNSLMHLLASLDSHLQMKNPKGGLHCSCRPKSNLYSCVFHLQTHQIEASTKASGHKILQLTIVVIIGLAWVQYVSGYLDTTSDTAWRIMRHTLPVALKQRCYYYRCLHGPTSPVSICC